MKKKLISLLLAFVLILTSAQCVFAFGPHDCDIQPGIGVSVLQEDIHDSKDIPGYDEDNKGNMSGTPLYGANPYIEVTQAEEDMAIVHYRSPYVVDSVNWELKYFYYKAGNDNIFKVTFETPLKIDQCAAFELGTALNGSGKEFTPAVSHFVTVDAGFLPPDDVVVEYKSETAWAWTAGAYPLNSIIKGSKWGWYLNADEGTFDVYAGAGKNDLSKGTKIGTVTVSIEDGKYVAEFDGIGAHYVTAMHFGVYNDLNALKATKGAPGKFTNDVLAASNQYMVIHFDAQVAVITPVTPQ